MPGKSNLQDHLDDIAQRHPEFAQQLRNLSDLDRKQERFEKQREEEEKREEPGPLRSGNLRNTVPDMQSSSQSHDETDRGQRSQSAPPESKHGPGQFVSKVDISGKEENQNTSPPSSQEPSQQKVFHIPIYVEGRDEPLLPKEATDPTILTPKQNRKTSNRVPVHESQSHKEPPVQKHNVHKEKSAPQPTQLPPPPPPPPPPSAQQPSEQPFIKDPLSQVAAVLKEVSTLKERVDAYKGNSKKDKEYMYLDEMLTRNLLKLDNIDTEGKEEVRTARKEVIKRIQECITQLEMAPATNCTALVAADLNATCPTSDPSPVSVSDTQQLQQEQMEVPENETSN